MITVDAVVFGTIFFVFGIAFLTMWFYKYRIRGK
jgi:hypothetical protein